MTTSKTTPRASEPAEQTIEQTNDIAHRLQNDVRSGLLALTSPDDTEHVRATVRAAVSEVGDAELTDHALGRSVLDGTLDAVGIGSEADAVVAAVIRHLVASAVEGHARPDDAVSGAVDAVSEREPRLVDVVESAAVEAYRAAGIVRGDRPAATG